MSHGYRAKSCAESILMILLEVKLQGFLPLHYIFFALNECVERIVMALKELISVEPNLIILDIHITYAPFSYNAWIDLICEKLNNSSMADRIVQ